MKKIFILSVLTLMIVILIPVQTCAQNSVTLSFTCQTTDGGYLQPDSITIENLTRNWTETIYYPDTVYTLNVETSVPEHPNDNGMLVMPNPFAGTTMVSIKSEKTEQVSMSLTDMGGRLCVEYHGMLEKGGNLFFISLSTPQIYVLTVKTAAGSRCLKMENVGHAGTNQIQYQGSDNTEPIVQLKTTSSHPFEPGDEMSFVVYTFLDDTLMAHQTLTQLQNTNENINVVFPVTENVMNLTSCPVVSVRTNETGFGNRVSHVQDYDGNEYEVVKIGNQCWMKENLKVTHTPSGSEILLGNSYSSTTPYRYYPNNDISNVSSCGYLYNWKAVMNGAEATSENPSGVQGLCPDGWHVPSDAEWTQLTDFVKNDASFVCGSNSTNIAKALAATMNWNSSSVTCAPGNDTATNNATGFTAIPSGAFSLDDYFGYSNLANFWGSSENGAYHATILVLSYDNTSVSSGARYKYDGVSVRCVRDLQNSGGGGGTTSGTPPSLHSTSISNTTPTTAYATSIVTHEGSTDVTARGFCWSSSHYPTLSDSYITVENGIGFGHFSGTLTGLTPGTTYYVRSWATNEAGPAYGPCRVFRTASTDGSPCPSAATVTDIDGNLYNTVQIGNQCWMKENLRTTHYADGTGIPFGGALDWGNLSSSSYSSSYPYFYNNINLSTASCGLLYNWTATMHGAVSSNTNPSGVQGICPDGWHVPSSSEWNQLTSYVGSKPQYICNGGVAKALSAPSSGWNQWYCFEPTNPLDDEYTACTPGGNFSSNNASGFSALPAGLTDEPWDGEIFLYCEVPVAAFWTSSATSVNSADFRNIYSIFEGVISSSVFGESHPKNMAESVRCVKD